MQTKEQHRAYMRQWYRRNVEKSRAWDENWKRANPDKTRDYKRRSYIRNKSKISACTRRCELQRLYGISENEYQALLIEQAGRCAICGTPIRSDRRLDVDHDHTTGKVRGLLCVNCNRKIKALENPNWLESGLKYLEKYV